jgi:hypothetical protein
VARVAAAVVEAMHCAGAMPIHEGSRGVSSITSANRGRHEMRWMRERHRPIGASEGLQLDERDLQQVLVLLVVDHVGQCPAPDVGVAQDSIEGNQAVPVIVVGAGSNPTARREL